LRTIRVVLPPGPLVTENAAAAAVRPDSRRRRERLAAKTFSTGMSMRSPEKDLPPGAVMS